MSRERESAWVIPRSDLGLEDGAEFFYLGRSSNGSEVHAKWLSYGLRPAYGEPPTPDHRDQADSEH